MENVEIARILEDYADLLAVQGANEFRVRAYQDAARTVKRHTERFEDLVEDEADLTEFHGIGEEMADHLRDIVRRATLPELEKLKREVPGSLINIMRLEGVGPKRAARLWRELDVTTVDELEEAAEAEEIRTLEGFGPKTEGNIAAAIESFRGRQGRTLLSDADQYVQPLLRYVRAAEDVQRAEVAGSYRRRKETVGDIDLLVVAEGGEAIMEHFTQYDRVRRVIEQGETRGTVELENSLQVDLRIVPERSYGAALLYFTGSKQHNIKLRRRAQDRELRISEYGVFRGGEDQEDPFAGELIAGESEKEVYSEVDLPWIVPELREDRGELEAAEAGELPDLIERDHLKGDLQMHSTWSDGRDELEAMVAACQERGYEYMAISDHSQALAMTGGLTEEELREQWQEVAQVQDDHPEIRILRSMEVDILQDGQLDLSEEMLAQLDIVIVAVHSHFDMAQSEQTDRVLKALGHPEVDVMAHPTARQINRRDPLALDVEALVKTAAENHVALELNSQPDRLDLDVNSARRAKEMDVPIVISTDAHAVHELDLIRYGVAQARRAWLEPSDVLNTRPLKDLLAFVE